MKKIKIPSTSAMVLALSAPLYDTESEKNYIDEIEFDTVNDAVEALQKCYPVTSQMVIFRKMFIRDQLSLLFNSTPYKQIVCLGVGFDPLSIYIVQEFSVHSPRILEVDMANMELKSGIVTKYLPADTRITFQECNFLNVSMLSDKLQSADFLNTTPTIIIFEGVIHFITEDIFEQLLALFKTPNQQNIVIFDFILSADSVAEHEEAVQEAFLNVLNNIVDGQFNTYSHKQIQFLINRLNAKTISWKTMSEIEFDHAGTNKFFKSGEGLEEVVAIRI